MMSGIKDTEFKCACGGTIRLHWNVFGEKTENERVRWYADCAGGERMCGNVTEWFDDERAALDAALAFEKPVRAPDPADSGETHD